jgi:hypothetical protein
MCAGFPKRIPFPRYPARMLCAEQVVARLKIPNVIRLKFDGEGVQPHNHGFFGSLEPSEDVLNVSVCSLPMNVGVSGERDEREARGFFINFPCQRDSPQAIIGPPH